MYNDDQLISADNARMMSKAYESFLSDNAPTDAVTAGEAKSIIAEMRSKCLSRQKKATLDSIARLLSIYPDPPRAVQLSGYYDGLDRLLSFACAELNRAISERQDIELPLTLAVMLILTDKNHG